MTRTASSSADAVPSMSDHDAIVVGAGFAGLYAIYLLRSHGLKVRGFDEAPDVGGTWYWNRYPGARCDIESFDYSYSFSTELQQSWTWSERYAGQPEILSYLQHVADVFDLREQFTFDTRVASAKYDEASNFWRVGFADGRESSSKFLIMATGCLSVPKVPEVSGLTEFEGLSLYTSRWPQHEPDLRGKRVAVIGTGSSGIQVAPILAPTVQELYVLQRTPSYTIPAFNRRLTTDEAESRKATYESYREQARQTAAGVVVAEPMHSAMEVSESERQQTYEKLWAEGNLYSLLFAYNDLLLDSSANESLVEFVHRKIMAEVVDQEVAKLLCPESHPIGTRRPCMDTEYYATFNQPNVHLVDLLTTPIVRIERAGIRTTGGLVPVDAIVFATGFDAMTGALTRVDIRGRGGRSLAEDWVANGPSSYLGLGISGYPNLFTVSGPFSPSVRGNMVLGIEQHVEWIDACIRHLKAAGQDSIEANREAELSWMRHVGEVADSTLFRGTSTWYDGSNVAGKPRVFLPYLAGLGSYRVICDEIAADGYRGFLLHGSTKASDEDLLLRTPG